MLPGGILFGGLFVAGFKALLRALEAPAFKLSVFKSLIFTEALIFAERLFAAELFISFRLESPLLRAGIGGVEIPAGLFPEGVVVTEAFLAVVAEFGLFIRAVATEPTFVITVAALRTLIAAKGTIPSIPFISLAKTARRRASIGFVAAVVAVFGAVAEFLSAAARFGLESSL
ncbi:MAG: hypothetical protein KGQ70_03125, partial [Alphaproteobacteria bacterium]|nr:hypothetical protein [Alphaproteobacteria bacterium]